MSIKNKLTGIKIYNIDDYKGGHKSEIVSYFNDIMENNTVIYGGKKRKRKIFVSMNEMLSIDTDEIDLKIDNIYKKDNIIIGDITIFDNKNSDILLNSIINNKIKFKPRLFTFNDATISVPIIDWK